MKVTKNKIKQLETDKKIHDGRGLYFFKKGDKIYLEAANPSYEPIILNLNEVVFQGRLLAVWRKV